jgi:hypothetical protein
MGEIRTPRPVTPLVALLSRRADWLDAILPRLEEFLGALELRSDDFPFDGTAYYSGEMGSGLKRRFYTFASLCDPADVVDWKLRCNELEREFSAACRAEPGAGGDEPAERPINIDPGYINGSKLVLASTKDYAHRIYLRDGVFAEITLGYRGDAWEHHYFTFPDYRQGHYFPFLSRARDEHLKRMTAIQLEKRKPPRK